VFTVDETKLINPKITKGQRLVSTVTTLTGATSQTEAIAASVVELNIEGVGGGGGGDGAQGAGSPTAGGSTTWILTRDLDSTTVASGTYLGGAAGNGTGSDKFRGDPGVASAYAAGGAGGGSGANGVAGSLGSGGGGGGGRAPDWDTSSKKGGAGGGAGAHGASSIDLSGEGACTLTYSCGNGGDGSGPVSYGDGADGGAGVLYYYVETDALADCALLTDAEVEARQSIGYDQSWTYQGVNYYATNQWYHNNSTRPIGINIAKIPSSGQTSYIYVADNNSGSNAVAVILAPDDNTYATMFAIVPPGKWWRHTGSGGHYDFILS